MFPREITALEKELLFSVLPVNKPGYAGYRDKIERLVVTGQGRFGNSNFILGKAGSSPDLSLPSSPVFALGTIIYTMNKADIVIHEAVDDEIEYDISVDNDASELNEIKRWNYSEWEPGDNAPGDNSYVKETEIVNDEFILAIAPVDKKIWLHVKESGINMLIPVTNFYNYLMMVKNIRDKEKVFKPALLFADLKDFNDDELRLAFIAYNKYFKRIKIDYPQAQPAEQPKKNIFKLFKRG
ncbi:MAG: hypothetical protein R6W90_09810 [Ignavibacteriaceae bacterium]